MAQLKVMDPVAQLASELGQFAPAAARPRAIERQRVGLYWNRKPGGNWALDHVGKLLTSRFPGAEAHFYNARRPIPEDVVADIRARCDGGGRRHGGLRLLHVVPCVRPDSA